MAVAVTKLLGFLAAGLPGFALAVPLNYLLSARLGMPKPAAYGLVLWLQVTVNFFLCRRFVFRPTVPASALRQYGQFLGGVALFRFIDWAVYSLIVAYTPIPFVVAQVLNAITFSLLKFRYVKSVFERRAAQQD